MPIASKSKEPEPPFPQAVRVWQDGRVAAATILKRNEDGTLDLECELYAGRVLNLVGVHQRQEGGNGWEPIEEAGG